MTRHALLSLACLLVALDARAEVAVDHHPSGEVTPFFEAGPRGAWDRVSERPAHDVLNELGDTKADGWPSVIRNAGSGRPEVVWSSGGTDSEILLSSYATSWSAPRNVSHDSATDEMPVLESDAQGNRFVAWARSHGAQRFVYVTAVASDDSCQCRNQELSRNLVDVRKPSLAVAADGTAYAAYEEHLGTGSPVTHVAIDRLVVGRTNGVLRCGGEDTIDIARQASIVTHRVSAAAAIDVRARAEGDEVWATWIDASGSVGFVQLEDGAFSAPEYRAYTVPGGDEAVREDIRLEVLAD